MTRRLPLVIVLAVLLAAVGVATSLEHSANPSALPGGFAVSGAQSTALYCTGLTDAAGGASGEIIFLNTARAPRLIQATVVSDTGQHATSTLDVPGHATRSLTPGSLAGNDFAVWAVVGGGGVVADVLTSDGEAQVPCRSAGVGSWYGAGFSTAVGSTAVISLFNPTATPAVVNLVTYSPSGYDAPAPYQGLSVAGHGVTTINLGRQIVNTSDVGVGVEVLRGSVDVVGVQRSGAVASFNAGAPTRRSFVFPDVTTSQGAVAQLLFANPSDASVTVTADVSLGSYTIPAQTVVIGARATGAIDITPNSAIPAEGYATVTARATGPVTAALATGVSGGVALSAPSEPADELVVSDLAGRGFDATTVTNTSRSPVILTYSEDFRESPSRVTLAASSTRDLIGLLPQVGQIDAGTLILRSSRPVLVVGLTLPSTPPGQFVVSALDGR